MDSPVGLRAVLLVNDSSKRFLQCGHKLTVKVNKQKNNDTENLIYNQHGERLAILHTENIKICG